jgi:hypothetical protein
MRTGKEPLPKELYFLMCDAYLQESDATSIFARCVQVLCVNLISRAGNGVDICLEHMSWEGDALVIKFCQTKTNQSGDEKKRHPMHVYANPVYPSVCPILSLGMYFLMFPSVLKEGSIKLFPGSSQDDHYRRLASKVMKGAIMQKGLVEHGFDKKDFGSHSNRKYGATEGSSSPFELVGAVRKRGGWSGQVMDIYVGFNAFKDQVLGRVLAGLPYHSADFALPPPAFLHTGTDVVRECMTEIWGSVDDRMNRIAQMGLASLVYHSKYILDKIAPDQPILNSAFFTTCLDRLKPLVVCRHVEVNDPSYPIARVTGVPLEIMILCSKDVLLMSC